MHGQQNIKICDFFSEDTRFALSRRANIHDTKCRSYQNPLYINLLAPEFYI